MTSSLCQLPGLSLGPLNLASSLQKITRGIKGCGKVKKVLVFLFSVCLMLAGPMPPAGAGVLSVTQADSGKEITIKVGDILRLELEEKGYDWIKNGETASCFNRRK